MSYTGLPIGGNFVQSSYPNQMATALPGVLANASDYNLISNCPVVGATGVVCGRAAFKIAVTGTAEAYSNTVPTPTAIVGGTAAVTITTPGAVGPVRAGLDEIGVQGITEALSGGGGDGDDFYGIAVRLLAGYSATTITPTYPKGIMAPVARIVRVGCRVWVESTTVNAVDDAVYCVTVADSGVLHPIGTFVNASSPDGATTFLVKNAKWVSSTTATSKIGQIEFFGAAS